MKIEKKTNFIQKADHLSAPSTSINNKSKWILKWSDEFTNETSLKNWNLQDWPSEKNNELQYYSPENIKLLNGYLIIESKKEKYKGRNYTSGAINTENKFEFKYGRVEIRAKIPNGSGIFPAFWLVNSNNNNWLPEIDIMENLGQKPNELYFVVHWENKNGVKMRDYFHYISDNTDFSSSYHKYGIIWDNNKILWTIDNVVLFETKKYIPNQPLFIYLNTAIGGDWPGNPDFNESFPKEMKIDYIRIYDRNEGVN